MLRTSALKSAIGALSVVQRVRREGLRASQATLQNVVKRAARLYEQEREGRVGPSAPGMDVGRRRGWRKGSLIRRSELNAFAPLTPPHGDKPAESDTEQQHG